MGLKGGKVDYLAAQAERKWKLYLRLSGVVAEPKYDSGDRISYSGARVNENVAGNWVGLSSLRGV
jgi:hypothetical protein